MYKGVYTDIQGYTEVYRSVHSYIGYTFILIVIMAIPCMYMGMLMNVVVVVFIFICLFVDRKNDVKS